MLRHFGRNGIPTTELHSLRLKERNPVHCTTFFGHFQRPNGSKGEEKGGSKGEALASEELQQLSSNTLIMIGGSL